MKSEHFHALLEALTSVLRVNIGTLGQRVKSHRNASRPTCGLRLQRAYTVGLWLE